MDQLIDGREAPELRASAEDRQGGLGTDPRQGVQVALGGAIESDTAAKPKALTPWHGLPADPTPMPPGPDPDPGPGLDPMPAVEIVQITGGVLAAKGEECPKVLGVSW